MVKAALFTPNLTMGGAEMWVVSLASSVDRRRLRWTGAVVSGWGGLDPFLCRRLAQEVPVHTNDGGWNKQRGARRIAEAHFEQIHESFGDAILAACCDADILVAWGGVDPKKYAPDLKIPIVQTSHTTEPARGGGSGFRSASHLAAVSEAAKAHFDGGRGDREVAVIYNGADWMRCQPIRGRAHIRRSWQMAEDQIAVGYLGRHSAEKNPRAAMDAVSRLPKRFSAVYYGGPTPRDTSTTRVLREAAKKVSPDRVIFRPPVSHVGDVLAGLDVFMLASRREAFSLGLIEAWLAGVPVVATPVGSLPELEKRFGKLTVQVPVDASARMLANAVRAAQDDVGQECARRAQEIAIEHFTSEAMATRWADYLQGIVSPQATSRRRKKQQNKNSQRIASAMGR
jgi:glycosyltransferase involved in cell wall biosynthesis